MFSRPFVLVVGGIYLCLAIALWTWYIATDQRMPYDDSINASEGADLSLFEQDLRVYDRPSLSDVHQTQIDRADVEAAVADEAGRKGPGATVCFPGEQAVAFGLWICTFTPAGGEVIPVRLEIGEGGGYRGVFVDEPGLEREFSGCCVAVRP